MPTGLGDEQLWLSATNDNTGTSTAFNDKSGNGYNGTASGTLIVADTDQGGSYAFELGATTDNVTLPANIGIDGSSYSVSKWLNNSQTKPSGAVPYTHLTRPTRPPL